MFEAETRAMLESGCSLIAATVSADGAPNATRVWGLHLRGADSRLVEVTLDETDSVAAADLDATAVIAITGADVRTLRSVQLKGRATGERRQASDDDVARTRAFCDAFFTAVVEIDGTDRALLERLRPPSLTVYTVEIDEVFDQTPGPTAGAALSPAP